MKQIVKIFILFLSFMFVQTMNAQVDHDGVLRALPSVGARIDRNLAWIDIESTYYSDVHVNLHSGYDNRTRLYYVNIIVTQNHKKVYSRRFNNAYMYLYGDGQIQVGKPGFIQMVIVHDRLGNCGKIRQFEGLYPQRII